METFLWLILYDDFLFFFFDAETGRTPFAAIRKSCQLAIFTQLGCFQQWGGCEKSLRNPILTLDIEGSVGGVAYLSRDRVLSDALEAARVQLPIHGGELEVAALLDAPLAALQPLAVVKPTVSDVAWIADLAP